jgi:hypothetical protein
VVLWHRGNFRLAYTTQGGERLMIA